MKTIPLEELQTGGANAPITARSDLGTPPLNHTFRVQEEVAPGIPMDALVVNKGTPLVVVALHGATNRETTVLPRFEWLRTLLGYDVSCIFFSDPTLQVSESIQLTWYTGTESWNGHAVVSEWSTELAELIGAERIIFMGSSGGGFAALQVSALTADSVALAFNAQTEIADYRVNGTGWGVVREYVQEVWPTIWSNLEPNGHIEDKAWADEAGVRVSAVKAYSIPTRNKVYLVQNREEFHFEDHYAPFLHASRTAGNDVTPRLNAEGTLHNPPEGPDLPSRTANRA